MVHLVAPGLHAPFQSRPCDVLLFISPQRDELSSLHRGIARPCTIQKKEKTGQKKNAFLRTPPKKGLVQKRLFWGGLGLQKLAICCAIMPSSAPRVGLHCHLPLSVCLCQGVTKSASRDQVCVSPLSFLSTSVLDPALPFCSS